MKKVQYNHGLTVTQLLSQNRNRCCICHNPAKPIDIYYIDGDQFNAALGNLAALCQDCYELAADAQESQKQRVIEELIKYKNEWEQQCLNWQATSYACRIIQDGKEFIYEKAQVICERYHLREGDEIVIDASSDEMINIKILKHRSFLMVGQFGKSLIKSTPGYEFHISFTATKDGDYVILYCTEYQRVSIRLALSILRSSTSNEDITSDVTGMIAYLESRDSRNQSTNLVAKDEALAEPKYNEDILPWRLLPPGEHPFSEIVSHCQAMKGRKPNIRFDIERLNQIYSLNPSKTYRGIDEFDGYFVFYFESINTAVLDCPIVGNAIYVLRGDWKTLSRLSKGELLKSHREDVVRIIHFGDWFSRLKELVYKPAQPSKDLSRNVTSEFIIIS